MMAGSTIGQRNALSAAALVVAAVLFVGVIVLSSTLLRSAQVDLTEEKLFTLSEGSERIAQSIDEPITLRFYFSDTLAREIPAIGIYAQRVRDLLEEFVRASDGKIRLEIYDPEPFSPAEDRAVAFGLQGVPVDQSGELVYFGLAGTNSTDDTETIAFFDQSRERFLEYDIARVVHNLANPEKRKVGLITSLPLSGSPYRGQPGAPDDSWIAYSQLEEFFEIEPIRASSGEIPEDIDVLLLVHPKDLTDETLFAIDQFVLRGGRLIAFIDPHSEADAARANPANRARTPVRTWRSCSPPGASRCRQTRSPATSVPRGASRCRAKASPGSLPSITRCGWLSRVTTSTATTRSPAPSISSTSPRPAFSGRRKAPPSR